ncbi:hypothetical protein [Comamonas sp. B-9]|uniref:hypothetical protein n=1 Tax=Comamonas sp. B-9 TaxID=1055192 RepID=UPI0011DD4789|nr:hypothetical protein [Comamonas sp. B-9]
MSNRVVLTGSAHGSGDGAIGGSATAATDKTLLSGMGCMERAEAEKYCRSQTKSGEHTDTCSCTRNQYVNSGPSTVTAKIDLYQFIFFNKNNNNQLFLKDRNLLEQRMQSRFFNQIVNYPDLIDTQKNASSVG